MPFAVAADGEKIFAAQFEDRWSGVVQIAVATGTRRHVRRFDREGDQAGAGAFDGRWLAWIDDHSHSLLSDWELRTWDAQTGRVRTIASVPRKRGAPIAGPYIFPVMESGHLAWTQSTLKGNTELHLYDLAVNVDRVVSRDHPGAPVIAWPWLVWAESSRAGEAGTLRIHSLQTGRRLEVPRALATVHPAFMGAAPGQLVWTEAWYKDAPARSGTARIADYRTLRYWRLGWDSPITIARAPEGDYAEFPSIAGDLVAWGGSTAQYVADLRSGSHTQVTPQYGSVEAKGRAVLISYNTSTKKTAHPQITITVVNAGILPQLPRCR